MSCSRSTLLLLLAALASTAQAQTETSTRAPRSSTTRAAAHDALDAPERASPAALSRPPASLIGPSSPEPRLTAAQDWIAGTLQDQLDADPTLVPFGKGALFVPTMTSGFDEPPVAVWKGDILAAEGTTGTRIVLIPGTYEVRLGSGAGDSERITVQATVREQATTVIPVSWAGLQVHVINEQATSVRASYELIRVEDRQYVGIGFGVDELAGEPLSTWIIPPGLYKIVRVGETYRARRDFSTVRIEPGRLTHFVLVVNDDNGDFVGGGEVPETELFRPRDGFFGSLVLGGDASFSARNNSVGVAEGLSFNLRGFADGRLSFEIAGAPLLIQLQVEEQQTKSPNLPFQNSNDRLQLDALYVYPLEPWVGPYVRAGGETNLFAVYSPFEEEQDIVVHNQDGTTDTTTADTFRLRPPLGLTRLKEGAGLHLRVFKSWIGEASLRAGVGARHSITRDLFALSATEDTDEDPNPGQIDFDALDSNHQVGIEASAAIALRLSRYVLVNLDFDGLMPFDDPSALIADVEGSVSLKLTSYASINYVIRLRQDPALSPDPSIEQDVRLRLSVELL